MDQLPINYLEQFSYLGIFTLLVLGGVLSPISEEIVLISVGYLIGIQALNKFIALPVSLAGVFIGDNILFFLSKKGGKFTDALIKRVTRDKLLKYEDFMKKHKAKAIFFLRFIIGLRFLGPMLAGLTKVKDKTFRMYDSLAILLYVPAMILIGYYFNDQLDALAVKIVAIRHFIFITFMVIATVATVIIINRKFIKAE
ncbi:MAG: DedA family protein [Candidatus Colwellbacteria bacterium]|nr:DedA family protein [Candidatus Colwellbacteria bacterium]